MRNPLRADFITNNKGVVMKRIVEFQRVGKTILIFSVIALFLGVFSSVFARKALADDVTDARHLTERAKLTLETFMLAPETEGFRALVK
jgi:hypothetical protein